MSGIKEDSVRLCLLRWIAESLSRSRWLSSYFKSAMSQPNECWPCCCRRKADASASLSRSSTRSQKCMAGSTSNCSIVATGTHDMGYKYLVQYRRLHGRKWSARFRLTFSVSANPSLAFHCIVYGMKCTILYFLNRGPDVFTVSNT